MLSFAFNTAEDLDALADTSTWILEDITTRDPRHRFGKGRIHVGSTREQVILAYSKARQVAEYDAGEGYYDGGKGYIVEFTYDENDRVTSICFPA